MPFDFSQQKLSVADLKLESFPALKVSFPRWSRLEARPRGADLSVALKAQVRDPLWLLTRQWQMGEFEGDDCGTPVFSSLDYDSSQIQSAQPLNPVISGLSWINDNDPSPKSINLRVQMADMWLRILGANAVVKTLASSFRQNIAYAFATDTFAADEESLRLLTFYRDRSFDGYLFYTDKSRFASYTAAQKTELEKCFATFDTWVKRTMRQPETKSNWNEKLLEYNYSVDVHEKGTTAGTVTTKKLALEEFYESHPDWYHLKVQQRKSVAETAAVKNTIQQYSYARNVAGKRALMPSPVQFAGMPESRFWAFEDAGTNFAAAAAGPLDSGRIAVVEFGLLYSNDWSLLPIKVPVGSLTTVRSLKITDSFGFDESIPAANEASNDSWNSWAFFSLDKMKSGLPSKPDAALAILPTITNMLKSDSLEEVVFVMDEMANLVWGIEKTQLALSGKGIDVRRMQKPLTSGKGKNLEYVPQVRIPENWIPFALVAPNTTQTAYRRGKMTDDSGLKIYPETWLLRYGLDRTNKVNLVYDIAEHEITRDGLRLQVCYHYGRWINGETVVWKAVLRENGSGEGSSGLAFDQLVYSD